MEFESLNHAIHYAKGSNLEILFLDNKVINVTDFKNTHPGGAESINKYIGKDCTELYKQVSSHKTSTAIRELKNFTIGKIHIDENSKNLANDTQETDIEYPIDLKKGTIWQVYSKLDKQEYMAFIHDPKHMIDPPEAIMFDNPFLEMFTKTSWYIIPIIWLPFSAYQMYIAYTIHFLTMPQMVIGFFIGILLWTLLEYFLHRFVFHLDEGLPNYSIAFLVHYLLHGIHHAFPMDK